MSSASLLTSLLQYKAWANQELIDEMRAMTDMVVKRVYSERNN